MGKNTIELEKALKECDEFKDFYSENKESFASGNFVFMLNDLINRKGVRSIDLCVKSGIGEVYGYQILNGTRHPKRNKALCLALGLGLTLEEAQSLLHAGNYATLYAKNPRDCVIMYAICKHMNVQQTNALLFEYNEETLI